MRWLVDGYNVIRSDPDLRGAEAQSLERGRAALLRLVLMAAERSRDAFTVVFDGGPRSGGPAAAPRNLSTRMRQWVREFRGALAPPVTDPAAA